MSTASQIPRSLARHLQSVSAAFPVLLLTGPRQVGKTTLLEMCAGPERNYVTLDDLEARDLARRDPILFLQRFPTPLIVDEIQYAPELFGAIKIAVDRARQPGMFWLTGSQKFHLMQGITETLAGRVAILDLHGLSRAEIERRAGRLRPFLPGADWLAEARGAAPPPLPVAKLYAEIWRGAFPALVANPDMPRDTFMASYVQTYIQRDVRDLARVGDERAFFAFLRAAAARTGQLLNLADLARDVDIDPKTAKSWLSILETSGLVHLLPPWHANVTKRLVKAPKLYFLDTGLCAWLTRWSSSEALEAGAMSGAILETWMLVEILKSHWHTGQTPSLYYYRDRDQREIDLLIERDGRLHPVEFKKTARPGVDATRHFAALERLGQPVGHGAVICMVERDLPLTREVDAIPAAYL